MKRRSLAGLVVALLTAASLLAYVTNVGPPWPDGNVTLYLQLGSTPHYSDGTNPNSTALAALQHWNQYMKRVQLVGNTSSSASKQQGNGTNDVFFSSTIYGRDFPQGVLGVTTIDYRRDH